MSNIKRLSCRRAFCRDCDEALIHRDNRKFYESASAFGQIIHREGPRETTVGDIDLYMDTRYYDASLFRIVERFQSTSPLKDRQRIALSALDSFIKHAAECPLFTRLPLLEGSGVCIVRGELYSESSGRRKTEFASKQTVSNLDGSLLLAPLHREELWSYLIGANRWSKRDDKPRVTSTLFKPLKHVVKKPALESIKSLLPRLTQSERQELKELLNERSATTLR
jgi:hypothetical protein